MDQRNDLVGEAALDMLISMVHHNERGVPEHPRATMIGCHWVDGTTVRSRAPKRDRGLHFPGNCPSSPRPETLQP